MTWLSRLLRRNRVEAQLDAELRDHLERQAADYVGAGMSTPEARRRAALELGGLEQVKELCRDARGTRWIEDLVQDLRYGARLCAKGPSFTIVATLTLALGIGANTAIFTLIHAVMLRPLPVRAPEELVAVGDPSRPTAHWEGAPMIDVLSYPMYEMLAAGVCAGTVPAVRASRVGPVKALRQE